MTSHIATVLAVLREDWLMSWVSKVDIQKQTYKILINKNYDDVCFINTFLRLFLLLYLILLFSDSSILGDSVRVLSKCKKLSDPCLF